MTTKNQLIVAGVVLTVGGIATYLILQSQKPKGNPGNPVPAQGNTITPSTATTSSGQPTGLTDKNGNTFTLSSEKDQYGNFKVYINGTQNGEVMELKKSSDGFIYGTNSQGRFYKYTTKWEQVSAVAGLSGPQSTYLLN
jgi:hypothetical protein